MNQSSNRYKTNAYLTYDKIAEWFDMHRSKSLQMERAYLELMTQLIPENGHILDAGCGTGDPIAQYFINQGYRVTGIDASRAMLSRCQVRLPEGRWILADMRTFYSSEPFDAIIAWHSFFHLPPEDQPDTLRLFARMLVDTGLLMFTTGDEYGEVWGNNGGYDLYHGSLSAAEYQAILTDSGLTVLYHNIRDPDCGDATVWVTQKKSLTD